MKYLSLLLISLVFWACNSNAQNETGHAEPTDTQKSDRLRKEGQKPLEMKRNNSFPLDRSDAEWREILDEKRYHILREKGTEYPHTGVYNLHFEKGEYRCAACDNPLFKSDQKFKSSCGWPSFDEALEGSVKKVLDTSHGMTRTEIVCANCGGHLGHVFNDGPTETGQRYCINSLSLDFEES